MSHCPAVGSGGFHSESYLEGGRCAWCGAGIPEWLANSIDSQEDEPFGRVWRPGKGFSILVGDGVGDLDLLPTPDPSRNR